VCRFLLLVAAHDTTLDESIPGLVKEGKKGTLEMLCWKRWVGDTTLTVEHVAPQTITGDWDTSLGQQDPSFLDTVGNLTLLPLAENSSIGNRPWQEKRVIYSVLAAKSDDEVEQILAGAQRQGVKLGKSTQELLKDSMYIPQVDAIAKVEGNWTSELVTRRSERLSEIVWTRLSRWLNC
jgi:hypothetical protein